MSTISWRAVRGIDPYVQYVNTEEDLATLIQRMDELCPTTPVEARDWEDYTRIYTARYVALKASAFIGDVAEFNEQVLKL